MNLFDPTPCILGEGPLWCPDKNAFYWLDITGQKLLRRQGEVRREWAFDEAVSAAFRAGGGKLVIASETALFRFDPDTGERSEIRALEADNPVTRSNDGRADPWGGLWIGTMGKRAEAQAGAIYRYFDGELRRLVRDLTVPNAICFAPDRSCAYYTDTLTRQVMRQPLEPQIGWPDGEATVAIDLRSAGLNPDGAVTDAQGNLWIAFWDAARVGCYTPDGTLLKQIDLPARRTTCPAFGGPDLRDLYVTSARQGLDDATPDDGATFLIAGAGQGLAEPEVRL